MLIAAADQLGERPTAQYNYAPLIRVLALTGLRVSEALALRWEDIGLFEGIVRVRHSLTRDGALSQPKTAAGVRNVPLAPGLVDLFAQLRHPDAEDLDFVFASRAGGRPISYWNFRRRGFQQALELAGLTDCGIMVHDLRHAAVSLYIASGLTAVEVAHLMGHADPSLTLRVYSHLFDRSGVEERIRAAQSLLVTAGTYSAGFSAQPEISKRP
jgi:integrase